MDAAVVDLGRVRGLALLKGKGPRFRHVAADAFYVPSSTGTGGYVVDLAADSCTCPAHEETGTRCKHLWAASFFRDGAPAPHPAEPVVSEASRLTYPQNWPAYNRAQCEEKERVQLLLRGLCDGIEETKQGMGRPRMPLRDTVYAAVMKVYGTMSGRRSTTDIEACESAGHLDNAPAYNTVFKYLGQPGLTPLLKRLVDESARPLTAIEKNFAADGTGFATQTYVRWHDFRHGEDRRVQRWVKAHAMVGTLTNIVTAIDVTEGSVNDSPMFAGLVERTTANGFVMREVSADKAYLSHANLAAVEGVGAQPFIPFKSNSTTGGSGAWGRRFLDAQFAINSSKGTRLVAEALRTAFASATLAEKQGVMEAAVALVADPQAAWSLEQIAKRFIPTNLGEPFLSVVHGVAARQGKFLINKELLREQINYRVFQLDTGVWVSAPFHEVGTTVTLSGDGAQKTLSCQGTVVGEKVERDRKRPEGDKN